MPIVKFINEEDVMTVSKNVDFYKFSAYEIGKFVCYNQKISYKF